MRPRMVAYRYSREFPHPAHDCYRWLTDYSDKDPELAAGAILREREVVERTPERIVLRVDNEILGRAMKGRAEVLLQPGRLFYEAKPLDGDGRSLHYTYQLTELGASRTRLDVVYRHRARSWRSWLRLHLARPLALRRIRAMWDAFARAMAADLSR